MVSVMLYLCSFCIDLSIDLFFLCVACLTVFCKLFSETIRSIFVCGCYFVVEMLWNC